jgi:HD superfamily phosphodiesterase
MPEPRYEITPICTPEDIQFAYAKARELLGLQNFKYAEYMTEHFEQVRATANLIMVEMGVKVEISPDS